MFSEMGTKFLANLPSGSGEENLSRFLSNMGPLKMLTDSYM